MRILIIDDEAILLEEEAAAVRHVLPGADFVVTQRPSEALAAAKQEMFDVAFLDVEMPGMNGVELAKELRDIYDKTNIIFVTAYSKYALDAHGVMSCGYFLKPLKESDVRMIMDNLRYPIIEHKKKLKANCFGYFDVYYDGKVVEFKRSLAKEILACLVNHRGAMLTKNDMLGILWPDRENGSAQDKSFYMGISELKKSLQDIGMEKVLLHSNVSYGVDVNLLDCDYLDFMADKPGARLKFHHEYMTQYFWAEDTLGMLEEIMAREKF